MTLINVAFADDTKTTISAAFPLPQSAESFPFQGQIDTSTSSAWATFYAELSQAAQEAWPAPPAASTTTA